MNLRLWSSDIPLKLSLSSFWLIEFTGGNCPSMEKSEGVFKTYPSPSSRSSLVRVAPTTTYRALMLKSDLWRQHHPWCYIFDGVPMDLSFLKRKKKSFSKNDLFHAHSRATIQVTGLTTTSQKIMGATAEMVYEDGCMGNTRCAAVA